MARLLTEDFATGFGAFTVDSVGTVTRATPSWDTDPAATAQGDGIQHTVICSLSSPVDADRYLAFIVGWDSNPPDWLEFATLLVQDYAFTVWRLNIDELGRIVAANNDFAVLAESGPLAVNQRHLVEVYWRIATNTTGRLTLRVNGVEVGSTTTADLTVTAGWRLAIGNNGARNGGGPVRIAAVAANDTSGVSDNTWVGDFDPPRVGVRRALLGVG